MDANKQTLEITDAADPTEANDSDGDVCGGAPSEEEEQTAADAAELIEALAEEVGAGMIQIETAGTKIIIRIREKDRFHLVRRISVRAFCRRFIS